MEDFEAINRMAMEQVARMDGAKSVEVPPVISQPKTSFWSNDYVDKYKPSQPVAPTSQSYPGYSSYAPRTYYSSPSTTGGSSMDAFYRRMLNAIYKQERREQPQTQPQAQTEKQVRPMQAQTAHEGGQQLMAESSSLTLFGRDNTPQRFSPAPTQSPQPRPVQSLQPISTDTRNQVTAIVLSGITKMATTMVLNWARDKRVPYELL